MDRFTIKLILYFFFFGILFLGFIFRFQCNDTKSFFFQIEGYAYLSALIYYFVMSILLFLQKCLTKTFDTIVVFFQKKFFKFGWTFNIAICFAYWGSVIIELNKLNNSGWDFCYTMFFHIIVQVILIIDLMVFDHTLETSYLADVIAISFIYLFLAVMALLGILVVKVPYGNVNSSYSFGKYLVYSIVIYMLILNMYFLHQFILMKKMHVSFGTTTVRTENEKLVA